jgi:hypothetical protein
MNERVDFGRTERAQERDLNRTIWDAKARDPIEKAEEREDCIELEPRQFE